MRDEFGEEMSEASLWRLANEYACLNEWKTLGTCLGLDDNDICAIESRYLIRDGLKECFYQCMLTWHLRQPENCSLSYFFKVLKRLNKPIEFIERLEERLINKSIARTNDSKRMLEMYAKRVDNAVNSLGEVKLDESHLWLASASLAPQWKTVARNLGLTELDLISIELKHMLADGVRECCYQSLLLWSQISYEHANLAYLCSSLIQMKFNLFAKQLLEQLLV